MEERIGEIVARLRRQKTDDAYVEAKASAQKLSSRVWDSVSAFANTAGGKVILGLDEGDDGSFQPVENFAIDVVRDQFVGGIGDGGAQAGLLTNPPDYGIVRELVDGSPVLVATIGQNRPGSRPCFVTAKGLQGGSYKRVDDKDIKLSATEIFEMQQELTVSDADRQLVDGADEADLDAGVVEDLLERRRHSKALYGAKSRKDKLARLNVTDKQGRVRLAGLLAVGVYPQQFFPRLLVDVAVHPGNEKSLPGAEVRFLDRRECVGKAADVVDDAVSAVVSNLRTYSVVEGVARRDVLEIPVKVLREAIANAVLHREYSPMFVGQPVVVDVFADRVEITSPGGLWGGATPENLADGISRCRNQILLPLMQHVAPQGYDGFTVEGQGGGVRMMVSEMEAHTLERPKFVTGPDTVKVVLFRHGAEIHEHRQWLRDERVLRGSGRESYLLAEGAPLPRDATDMAIIRGLSGKEPQSVHDIVEWSGLSIVTARTRLRRLVEDGWVHATAPPQSRNRRYVVGTNALD